MQLIRRGGIGQDVEDVQRRLGALGHVLDDEPGIFAASTEMAVRSFQQQRGLPSDGVVGPDTWTALVGASYRLGDRLLYETRPYLAGDDVRDLQQRLSQLGFDPQSLDGIYGQQTLDAVREFQLNVGLVADGMVGPATLAVLGQLRRGHQLSLATVARDRYSARRDRRDSLRGLTVVVDAARGPGDPGASTVEGTTQHEIDWQLASCLAGRLTAIGARVFSTRGPNTTPSDFDRVSWANQMRADLIISFATNATTSTSAAGSAVYYFGTDNASSERGRLLADSVQQAVVEGTGAADCRIHAESRLLLRGTRAVTIVVEPGYVTNPEEGRKLSSGSYQRKVAEATIAGITRAIIRGSQVLDTESA